MKLGVQALAFGIGLAGLRPTALAAIPRLPGKFGIGV